MRVFYMGLILWGCGEKKVQNATVSSNQSKIKPDNDSKSHNSEVPKQETSQEKASVQLKYFHQDFIEKGTNPKYLGVDVIYVSEQQVLDDLYLLGKQQEHFYPCQSTGATFLSIEGAKARVQLQGGCGGCGSFGIYDHISDTLQQLQHISKVQILAPNQKGAALSDRPSCLDP